MTDKQIIIDGCNVSGCKWFTHNQLCECAIKPADDFHCHANPNCYYKQLKLKEQECERLKHDNGYEVGALEKTIDNLKAENKHLNDLLNQALKDYEKARETLTEIKEIAKNGCYDDCGMPLDELSIILQKISEVVE